MSLFLSHNVIPRGEEKKKKTPKKKDWEKERLFIVIHINIEGVLFICRTATTHAKHLEYKPIIRDLLMAH